MPRSTASPPPPQPAASRPVWPWAVGTIVVVVLVLLATVVGQVVVSHARHAAQVVAPPATAPLPVVAVAHPGAQYIGVDATSGHLVALTSTADPNCPPPAVGACPATPALDHLTLLDDTDGTTLARTPLTGNAAPATGAVALLVDTTNHHAYAVAPHAVSIFSSATGAYVGGYALPSAAAWSAESGAALDAPANRLLLAGNGTLLVLDARTGVLLATQTYPTTDGIPADGPVLDVAHHRVYLGTHPDGPTGAALLHIYDDTTLQPAGTLALPAGARLGPLDPRTDQLYVLDLPNGGTTATVNVAALAPSGATSGVTPAPLRTVAALDGALALGFDDAQNTLIAATASDLRVINARSGDSTLALPVRAAWPPTLALPLDASRGLLYVPLERGSVVLAHDTTEGSPALTPATALLLARAAMASLLPDTNQTPPFVTASTFPAWAGTRASDFYINFSDLGWRGPYRPGSASAAVAPASNQSGAYTVTFKVTWYQLFTRTHTWVCRVLPDGSVHLVQQTGDVIP